MAKKGKILDSIVDTSATLPGVDHSEIEVALGATASNRTTQHAGRFSLSALQSSLMTELVSTGGRPGRQAVSRKKVPLTQSEWQRLDDIARLLRLRGVNATSGQVAGILLHHSINEVVHNIDQGKPTNIAPISAASLSDTQLEETVEGILEAAASAEVHLEQLRPVALELLRRMRTGRGVEGDDDSK